MNQGDEPDAAFERYLQKPGPEALAPVVRLLHQEVWRIALRVAGNEEDASDVTQDLFLGLLLSPPAPGSIRSHRGYLVYRVLTLAARRARAAARREKREAAAARRLSSGEASPQTSRRSGSESHVSPTGSGPRSSSTIWPATSGRA